MTKLRTVNALHRKRSLCAAALLFFAALSAAAVEQPPSNSPSADRLRAHVGYLASDELTGRGVGTPGIGMARDYIAAEFKRLSSDIDARDVFVLFLGGHGRSIAGEGWFYLPQNFNTEVGDRIETHGIGPEAKAGKLLVPERYTSPESSKLTIEVESGKVNAPTLELKSP